MLVNSSVPVPSEVLLSAVVGLGAVLQQTPRADTVAPPSEDMLPPLSAVVGVIDTTELVVRVGVNSDGDSFLRQRTE